MCQPCISLSLTTLHAFTKNLCTFPHLPAQDNVAYDIMGHTFFFEDGVETGSTLQGNLGVLTRVSNAMLNTDTTPATFWVSGAHSCCAALPAVVHTLNFRCLYTCMKQSLPKLGDVTHGQACCCLARTPAFSSATLVLHQRHLSTAYMSPTSCDVVLTHSMWLPCLLRSADYQPQQHHPEQQSCRYEV